MIVDRKETSKSWDYSSWIDKCVIFVARLRMEIYKGEK